MQPAAAPVVQEEGESWKTLDPPAASLYVCPTAITMYVGESQGITPIATDSNGNVVHSAPMTWATNNAAVAEPYGNAGIAANGVGTAMIMITSGTAVVNLDVTVLAGERPEPGENDYENVNCTSAPNRAIPPVEPDCPIDVEIPLTGSDLPLDGGDEGDGVISLEVTAARNAVGSPYNMAQAKAPGSPLPEPTKDVFGSTNYQFVASAFGLGGREIGAGLALSYNSQLWSYDENTNDMTFNVGKGWPAAGWRLGYGRIIKDFNAAGSNQHLLITGDGTRITMVPDSENTGGWTHKAADGSFVRLKVNSSTVMTVLYPDGTQMKFVNRSDETNSRWLPTEIKTRNGNFLTISYVRYHPHNFPVRWAISAIRDTLGRTITFNYDNNKINGTCVYGQLRSITGPGPEGTTSTYVRLEYDLKTIHPKFTNVNPANFDNDADSQLLVVKRIIYPETGRGYEFQNFSPYGMAKKIVALRGLVTARDATTGQATAFGAGVTTASTTYTFNDVNPIGGATLPLDFGELPEYTKRTEVIHDENGSAYQTTDFFYSYTRLSGDPETATMTTSVPGVANMVTTSDPATGRETTVEYLSGSTVLRKMEYEYDGGNQPSAVKVTEQGLTAETRYEYGAYDRLEKVREFGFGGTAIRTAVTSYKNTTAYLNRGLAYLVESQKVYSGNEGSGTLVSQVDYSYDNYSGSNTLEGYSLSTAVTGHDLLNYGAAFGVRGNITNVTYFPVSGPQTTAINRGRRYDVFGNVVKADVSCCQKKLFTFSSTATYSVPVSVQNGESAPTLTTALTYDPNTALAKTVTAPGGQKTGFTYDRAGRAVLTEGFRLGSTAAQTQVAMTYADSLGNDLQTITSLSKYKENYVDSSFTRTITEISVFDGAGRQRVAKTARPSGGYDQVKTDYDGIGRVTQSSTPYVTNPAYWTIYSYDALSRNTLTTLPDQSTTSVAYPDSTGALQMTVTDPVNRKWTRKFDGLGRLIAVVEDPNGAALETTYEYDVLDNLVKSNQGGQIREFLYDGMSRLMFERTPEQDATISYGAKFWSASYVYEDSGDIDKMRDARGVETDYSYDTLNRLKGVTYAMGAGAPPPQPASNTIQLAENVTINYNDTAGSPGRGQVASVSNGVLSESYNYDNFGRVLTTARTLDGRSTVGSTYLYTSAGQATGIKYPGFTSTPKQLRYGHDARGRLNLVDKGTWSAGGVFTNTNYSSSPAYVWGVTYGNASNTTPLALTEMTLGYANSTTSGLKETYTYSPTRLQLTEQKVNRKSGAQDQLLKFTYGYDTPSGGQNSGQLRTTATTIEPANPTFASATTETFLYDALGRLDTASKSANGTAEAAHDTIGLYDPSTSFWLERYANAPGGADNVFGFGAGGLGWLPIDGDWNADGTDSIGVYDPSAGNFFLRNANSLGAADVSFNFGPGGAGWLPIAGDWNADGTDSIGLYDPATGGFFLKNANANGGADYVFTFGPGGAGWTPIAGDWDGDGDDTVGLYDPATGAFYLLNSNSGGASEPLFTFGAAGWKPIAGDWNNDGTDTIGAFDPSASAFYLRNSNTGGGADVIVQFGGAPSSLLPLAGDWNGPQASGSSWMQDYTYDRWGNRTATQTVLSSGSSTQTVAIATTAGVANNRIASVNGGPAYEYDQNGNVVSDGVYTYVYDMANRLRQVKTGSTVIATYSYDAANRRVKQSENGTVRYSFWEGMHVVTEYTIPVSSGSGGTPTLAAQYVFAGDRMIAYENPTTVNFTHPDRLSTRMMTNTAGNIVGTQSHRPFGEDDTSVNLNEKHRFTNYERDGASGLDYAMNRHYGSGTGRFVQPDPVSGSAMNPQRANRYAYATADPVNLVDPLGLDPVTTHTIDGLPVSADFFQRYGITRLATGSLLDTGGLSAFEYGIFTSLLDRFYEGADWRTTISYVLYGGGRTGMFDASAGSGLNDCHRFADTVAAIASRHNDVSSFVDELAKTFIGLPSGDIGNMARANHNSGQRYNSTGWRPEFRDRIADNQARHFIGGLIAGFKLGAGAGANVMNHNESSAADLKVNEISVPLGAGLVNPGFVGYREKPGPGGVPVIAHSAGFKALANQIRLLICKP